MNVTASSILASCALVALPTLVAVAPVSAEPPHLVGTWNGPADTRGIVQLQITRSGDRFTIHAWGACSPSACDMGAVQLSTFGASVESSRPNGGTANFTESFATRTMTVTLTAAGDLRMDLFTKFTDHSGRQNYDEKEKFTRA